MCGEEGGGEDGLALCADHAWGCVQVFDGGKEGVDVGESEGSFGFYLGECWWLVGVQAVRTKDQG